MAIVKRTRVLRWLEKNHDVRKPFLIGGADSTKSYSVAQYLILNKFFGETKRDILVLRKTRVDCKDSCYKLMTEIMEDLDLPYHINKSDLLMSSLDGRKNTIKFTGMDERNKFKSKEYNYVWLEETTEFSYDDYLEIVRRCRRKTNTTNQIISTLNPIDAHSWIKTDIVDKPKKNVAIDISTVDDNPFAAQVDIDELDELKDIDINQYNVYRHSKWGVLKHIIYTGWKAYSNGEEYGKGLIDVSYGVDWGYAKPAAIIKVHWFENDKVIWEEIIHEKGLTTPQFIELAKERISVEDRQKEFYAGPDEPGSIQQFYDAGFNIDLAVTHVQDGINYCKSHLVGIIGANLIKEIQGYKRKEDKNGNVMEEPVKFMDHGCFIAGTLVKTSKGEKSIENIKVGDMVLTRKGYYPVIDCGMTNNKAEISKAIFSNGNALIGTGNHPIWIRNEGYVTLDALRYGDIMETWKVKELYLKVYHFVDTLMQRIEAIESILNQVGTKEKEVSICIERSGKMLMVKSLKVIVYIIKTTILPITNWKILNLKKSVNIVQKIVLNIIRIIKKQLKVIWKKFNYSLRNGINQKRAISGIVNMLKRVLQIVNLLRRFVIIVEKSTRLYQEAIKIDSAQMPVSHHGVEQTEKIIKQDDVSIVGKNSLLINIQKQNSAQIDVAVLTVGKLKTRQPVYNLTVKSVHEYYANGVLVSNCDAGRYGTYSRIVPIEKEEYATYDERVEISPI